MSDQCNNECNYLQDKTNLLEKIKQMIKDETDKQGTKTNEVLKEIRTQISELQEKIENGFAQKIALLVVDILRDRTAGEVEEKLKETLIKQGEIDVKKKRIAIISQVIGWTIAALSTGGIIYQLLIG